MNRKINTICFIFLFFFLICAVSAADYENETQKTIYQACTDENQDICQAPNEYVKLESESLKTNEVMTATQKATKQKVVLNAPNVNMYYKDGHKFSVTLKDESKKAICKAKVKISINGATYNKITDSKGTASINLNLKSGNYIVLTTFEGDGKYAKQSAKSTVNIKSTIKCYDLTKFYKNPKEYSSKFYDTKGNLLKNTAVKFKLNGKTYSAKTDNLGVAKLKIDLKPGTYRISSINPKTAETIIKTITINSLIKTTDLTMTYKDKSKFNVKILNCYGKPSPNKKIAIKVNKKTYAKTTDKNGMASLPIDLEAGTYTITTEFDGLKKTNKITVKPLIKHSLFSHITLIPSYVNVSNQYVFHNSAYVVKTGSNGIIRMPKNEIFTILINGREYMFSRSAISGIDTRIIGSESHLVPFDGSEITSDIDKSKLKGTGIIISASPDFTEIEYRNTCKNNTEMFGAYADKGFENSETITYVQNDKIKAKINFYTVNYDEYGIKYNLAKLYGKNLREYYYKSYDDLTNNQSHLIRFANTGQPVTLSYFGKYIVGYPSKEDIITKFLIDGKEELEKGETISYGFGEKYRYTFGFEVLQSYAIINEKITTKIVENWVSANPSYLYKFGVMNVYGMFMASLETAWIADKLANNYTKEYDVEWRRDKSLTILGGINLDDTYLHVLNSDMGMVVKGNEKNVALFRLINSLNLPNIEDYSLSLVAKRFLHNASNSQANVFSSIANGNYSITQFGDLIYLFGDNDSAIILNTTSGVCNVVLSHNDAVYKGSQIATSEDCCGVTIIPKDILAGIRETIKITSPGLYQLTDKLNKIHPVSVLAQKALSFILSKTLTGASSAAIGLYTAMILIQDGGVKYRDGMIDEKDWHSAMDTYTFTRPGYLQGKKVYNIPNENGGYDYLEVKINDDLTLDRNNVTYICSGKTKHLSKEETYQYFCEDYWTPFSMPGKYWDNSWKGK